MSPIGSCFHALTPLALIAAWACATLPSTQAAAQAERSGRVVASFITRIRLPDLDLELPAKLDTGAKSSSLHAERIVAFERKGRLWVRFRFAWGASPRIVIERPVIRIARIRRAGVGVRQRYVVRLRLCVAGKTAVTAFTLADRTGMRYAVLVGRRFLNGRILVASRRGSRGLKRC